MNRKDRNSLRNAARENQAEMKLNIEEQKEGERFTMETRYWALLVICSSLYCYGAFVLARLILTLLGGM